MPITSRRQFCTRFAAGTVLFGSGAGLVAGCAGTAPGDPPVGYPAMVGEAGVYTTVYEDTLVDLARRFGLGYLDLAAANPAVDPWVPGADVEIVLPTAHIVPDGPKEGILVNLADQRLYFFRDDRVSIATAPVGIGAEGWATPIGRAKVVRKKKNPSWYVPASVRRERPELPAVVPPGPDNPLGSHALYLDWPSYLLHGTNKPDGVGRRVSHGCVRLYPEDAARFYEDVAIGTPVLIVDQDLKIARVGDALWIEVHLTQSQAVEFERSGKFTAAKPRRFARRILSAAGDDAGRVDWSLAEKAARERRGLPIQILKPRNIFRSLLES